MANEIQQVEAQPSTQAEKYASWIVNNADKKGTPQFETVSKAYQEARKLEQELSFENATQTSVLASPEERSLTGVMGQSVKKGLGGLGDIVVGFPQDVGSLYKWATTTGAPPPQKSTPVTGYMKEQGIITPQNEPNTPVLKAVDFTTQLAASGGLNPMSMGRSLLTKPSLQAAADISKQFGRTGAAGAVGSATEQVLSGAGASPIQQMIGTGLTMAGTGALTGGVRTTQADIANKGLKGVTDEQLQAARAWQEYSQSIGSPITAAEAIAYVTGNKSLVGAQRFLENAPSSQGTMNQFMMNRPAGQRFAFENAIGDISQNAPSVNTPFRLQQSGQQVIRGAEKDLTKVVEPYYQQAAYDLLNVQAGKGLPVMPKEVAALQKNSAIQDALDHVVKDKYAGAFGLSQNDPRTLIAAKKYLDAQYNKFGNKMVESFDKEKAANAWGASRELDAYLSSKSPVYAQGSKIYETAQRTQFDPMRRGGVGQIAEQTGTPEQLMRAQESSLMPPSPRATTPTEIERTVRLLRRKDPTAAADWTRQNLEGIFNETTQKLTGGENQFGGSKFAASIAGNKAQRDNLKALVTSSSGMQAWQGFENFLGVMEAQGQRMPANSATAFNEMIRQEMSGGLASKAATPFKISNVVNWLEMKQLGGNAQALAKILTDPESVKKLEELARTGPKSAKGQAIANSLAGSYIAGKPDLLTIEVEGKRGE